MLLLSIYFQKLAGCNTHCPIKSLMSNDLSVECDDNLQRGIGPMPLLAI